MTNKQRMHYFIQGIVQGVGFRPFVVRIAREEGLTGFVLNTANGVEIELEGKKSTFATFEYRLWNEMPPLARIDTLSKEEMKVVGESTFTVRESYISKSRNTLIMADIALCKECLRELREPSNFRYQYPFITCTNCGPRYSIIRTIPYDRPMTTMATFPMCDYCSSEYEDISNRRYKAEPIACDHCGPQYHWYATNNTKNTTVGCEAIAHAKAMIQCGNIIAIKGIGGYHLACDARSENAVTRLRTLKCRTAKPFALLAGSLEAIEKICYVTAEEKKLLLSPAAPIVLLKKKESPALSISPMIAPTTDYLGVMLPYTGIHYMLLEKEDIWVMTSGNPKGFAIQYEDNGLPLLEPMCDGVLTHNRDIIAPVDDSVTYITETGNHIVRRSRGYVPLPLITKNNKNVKLLAMGGDLKNTFTLTRNHEYFIGPHLGDMAIFSAKEAANNAILHYETIFATMPDYIVIDSHPNYISSQIGRNLAKKSNLPCITIDHHFAHIGAILAEHIESWEDYAKVNHISQDILPTTIGLAFDGTGYGADGAIWGSELLLTTPFDYKRLAHLSYMPLYQGDIGVLEPWRAAYAFLVKMYGSPTNWPSYWKDWTKGLPAHWEGFEHLLPQLPHIPHSSMGRLFDLVGALLGPWYQASFDGDIPIRVECLAGQVRGSVLPYEIKNNCHCYEIQIETTLASIVEMLRTNTATKAELAASFHKTIIAVYVDIINQLERSLMIPSSLPISLGGGCWMNRRLETELLKVVPNSRIWVAKEVPANDGGLSLGQAFLASHLVENREDLCV